MECVTKRKVEAKWGSVVIVNEYRTCPICSVESNAVEWPWKGKPVDSGYQVTNTCPSCEHNFVEVM